MYSIRAFHAGDSACAMEDRIDGWWCVRHGDPLACVEAPSAAQAIRRSLDLHALGDWTDDARELVVFPRMRTLRMRVLTTTPGPC